MPTRERRRDPLLAIGLFKLAKAALLLAVAVGAQRGLRGDVQGMVKHWAAVLRVDPNDRFVNTIASRLTGIRPQQLEAIRLGLVAYGGLFAVEGIGLLRRKRWAEWLTVVSTALLLPVEVYEIHRR